jgi:hypothetical protein
LREGRLTGSAIPNVMGWFDHFRPPEEPDWLKIWREKLKLRQPDARRLLFIGG